MHCCSACRLLRVDLVVSSGGIYLTSQKLDFYTLTSSRQTKRMRVRLYNSGTSSVACVHFALCFSRVGCTFVRLSFVWLCCLSFLRLLRLCVCVCVCVYLYVRVCACGVRCFGATCALIIAMASLLFLIRFPHVLGPGAVLLSTIRAEDPDALLRCDYKHGLVIGMNSEVTVGEVEFRGLREGVFSGRLAVETTSPIDPVVYLPYAARVLHGGRDC